MNYHFILYNIRTSIGNLDGKTASVRVPVVADVTAATGLGTLGGGRLPCYVFYICQLSWPIKYLGGAGGALATLGHAARVPRADHRGGVVVAPLPPRKTQVSVLPGRLEPVRTHGRVALVLDSSSAASNLVGNEPGAILLVKEEQAGSVLVDRVASAAAEQEVGAEAALLVGNGLRVLCVQLNLPAVAQTKV